MTHTKVTYNLPNEYAQAIEVLAKRCHASPTEVLVAFLNRSPLPSFLNASDKALHEVLNQVEVRPDLVARDAAARGLAGIPGDQVGQVGPVRHIEVGLDERKVPWRLNVRDNKLVLATRAFNKPWMKERDLLDKLNWQTPRPDHWVDCTEEEYDALLGRPCHYAGTLVRPPEFNDWCFVATPQDHAQWPDWRFGLWYYDEGGDLFVENEYGFFEPAWRDRLMSAMVVLLGASVELPEKGVNHCFDVTRAVMCERLSYGPRKNTLRGEYGRNETTSEGFFVLHNHRK